jgi:hypothetical protein
VTLALVTYKEEGVIHTFPRQHVFRKYDPEVWLKKQIDEMDFINVPNRGDHRLVQWSNGEGYGWETKPVVFGGAFEDIYPIKKTRKLIGDGAKAHFDSYADYPDPDPRNMKFKITDANGVRFEDIESYDMELDFVPATSCGIQIMRQHPDNWYQVGGIMLFGMTAGAAFERTITEANYRNPYPAPPEDYNSDARVIYGYPHEVERTINEMSKTESIFAEPISYLRPRKARAILAVSVKKYTM